ncbi:MAG: helix-turn-helix transcriptional regulator [Clostridia bacterium]|nr:helix-turn-helix transcriptional regulator [Clostridia bacterium]
MQKFDFLDKKQHGTVEFPVEYYFVDNRHPRYQMATHWHSEWELLRVLEGTLQIALDEQDYTLHAGDILLIAGETLHGGTPTDCVYECLVFDLYGLFKKTDAVKPCLRPFYHGDLLPDRLFTNADPAPKAVMELFTKGASSPCIELETLSAIGSLFAWLIREKRYVPAAGGNQYSSRIKSVLEYIEAHYNESLSLDILAEVAMMNARYFCRVFYSVTHSTPMNYVNFYRIEQAAYLLDTTERTVTEIAAECGFWESSYFTKVFKKYKGTTPQNYRRRK